MPSFAASPCSRIAIRLDSRMTESRAAGTRHRLLPRPYDFEECIEGRPRQPHDTRAEVIRDRGGLVTHSVLGRGCDGAAGIPVRDHLARDYHAGREVHLDAECPST